MRRVDDAAAQVGQQHLKAVFLFVLRLLVHRPILRVCDLLREGQRLGFDQVAVAVRLTLDGELNDVEMFALSSTCALFGFSGL